MELEFLQTPFLIMIIMILFAWISIWLTMLYPLKFRILYKHKTVNPTDEKLPVSVVITAKNEHDNLKQNLPFILEQKYPQFEVVVVVNESDDNSGVLLRNLEARYSNLKVVNFEKNVNFFKDKKFPIAIGIKSASYEHILFTTPGCRPASEYWIDQMQSAFTSKKNIVIGYQSYVEKPNIFNKFLRFDRFQQSIKFLCAALRKKTYTATMENVGYTKTLFYNRHGISEFYDKDTGNDDLFVCKAAKKENVNVQLNAKSFIKTAPLKGLSEWFGYKRKHQFVATYFNAKTKRNLFLFNALSYLFYIALAALLCLPSFYPETCHFTTIYNFEIVALLFICKFLSQGIVYSKCMRKLNEKNFLLLIPFFEIWMILMQPAFLLGRIKLHSRRA